MTTKTTNPAPWARLRQVSARVRQLGITVAVALFAAFTSVYVVEPGIEIVRGILG